MAEVLREGRTLRELQTIADRVYGTAGGHYLDRQYARFLTLGTLKGRPWGEHEWEKVREIVAVAAETVGQDGGAR